MTLLLVQEAGPQRWPCSRLLSSPSSTSCTWLAGCRSGCAAGCRLSPLRHHWQLLLLARLATNIAASAGLRALVMFSRKIAFLHTMHDDCKSRLREMLHINGDSTLGWRCGSRSPRSTHACSLDSTQAPASGTARRFFTIAWKSTRGLSAIRIVLRVVLYCTSWL